MEILKFDEMALSFNDIIHVTVDTKDQTLMNNLTNDLRNAYPSIGRKFLVTSSGIKMKTFTKDELKIVRNDLNAILGEDTIKEEPKVNTSSIDKTKNNSATIAYRIRKKNTTSYIKSNNGKTIWLRKPNIKSLCLYPESSYEIVTFNLVEQ